MTKCNYPMCDKEVGEQDRDDYDDHKYCSIQHQTKYEHVRQDARERKAQERKEAEKEVTLRYE